MAAPNRWEVVRMWGDDRPHERSTHKSAELAEKAFSQACASNTFYAVDVSFLPHGRVLAFEPMYGIANGFHWYAHEGHAIYTDYHINGYEEDLQCPA